jgi:hypothetical protein
MRTSLFALALVPALAVAAQQPAAPLPPPGSNWQHVQALPSGTSLYVNANGDTRRCTLTSVDADTLTCAHGKQMTFQRTAIKSIKIPRRTASTLITAGLGAGVGVVTVAGASAAIGFGGYAKGTVYAGGAGIGAVLFGAIGFLADDARSTVYKAP